MHWFLSQRRTYFNEMQVKMIFMLRERNINNLHAIIRNINLIEKMV